MIYEQIRKRLYSYYTEELDGIAKGIKERVFSEMDSYDSKNPGLSTYKLKSALYEKIVDAVKPKLFPDIPFYFETGALCAFSDGKFNRGMIHANGWLYLRNSHLFADIDPHAFQIYRQNSFSRLYAQTAFYVDMMHMGLPMKRVFAIGLNGILSEVLKNKAIARDSEAAEFLEASEAGIRALLRIEEKLAMEAENAGMEFLAEIARRVPAEPPKTYHEGLCTLAFIRKALGAIEGVGFSSFGRVDVLLKPLYDADIARGVSEEELLDLTSKFLLIWDCALDMRKPMQNNFEYELENTLTLGGCDEDGNPVFNGVTKLFLLARKNMDTIYPKMMLRYSKNSPEEYMNLICEPLLVGKNLSLFENDDSIIPALIKSGIEKNDALNYVIGGCWDALTPDVANKFSGEYLNILRPLEWAIHLDHEIMEKNEIYFEPIDDIERFDELYERYFEYLRRLLMRKAEPMSRGSRMWSKVHPTPALSAMLDGCLEKQTDLTAGGGKYNRECVYFTSFAETVDSLLAIKKLCFDDKVCTLRELLEECRSNWKNLELRKKAIDAPSFGDGSEETSRFVGKFTDDLYAVSRNLPTAYGGDFRIGSNQYTEIIWWGQETRATPNGRFSGDYLSQGMTPSRIQSTPSISDMFLSYRYIDFTKFAGNTSVTPILPAGNIDIKQITAFLKAASTVGLQAIQLNCVSRDTLLKARENPESYGHIIVRVCGFSAPFVKLSPLYQDEFLSRCFHEK